MHLHRTSRAAAPGLSSEPMVECLGRHLAPGRADALLRAAGRGDRAAFGTFFDRTAPVVLNFLRRALSSRSEAERVAEDVYVHLWRASPRFAPDIRSAHAQLLLSIRNELIRRRRSLRGAKRHRRAPAPVQR